MKRSSSCLVAAVLVSSLAVPSGLSAAVIPIGTAGAVLGRVLAMAPEAVPEALKGVGRIISSGKTVYHMDSIKTDDVGRLQVMLRDETVFTIGPNTELVLDEFVYDPTTDAGKVTARVTKGVFRFVTGKIAHERPSSMKVKLPVGTIGIRGTMVAARTDGVTASVVLLGPGADNNSGERVGALSVTNAGVTVDVNRPGFGTVVPGPDLPPLPAFQFSPEQLAALDVNPDMRDAPSSGGDSGSDGSSGDQGGSASQDSGQSQASALGDLSNAGSLAEAVAGFDSLEQTASQEVVPFPDRISQWEEVRTLNSGSGFFAGEGAYTCLSGCSNGGSFSFMVDVDFAARQLNGGSIGLNDGDLSGMNTYLLPVDFSALSGQASVVLDATAGNHINPSFDGTVVSLLNVNNAPASQMRVDLNVNDPTRQATATGSAQGGFTDLSGFNGYERSFVCTNCEMISQGPLY